jgi:hypothetical protein
MSHQLGQNPTAIWQAQWAKCLDEIMFHLQCFAHMDAWNDLVNMKAILPPDCETDVEQNFVETEKIVFKRLMISTVTYRGEQTKRNYREYVVIPAERKLLTAIKKSLFDRGWINRPEFSAQPKFEKKGHL